VTLSNVTDASTTRRRDRMRSEFAWSPEEADRAAKFADLFGI